MSKWEEGVWRVRYLPTDAGIDLFKKGARTMRSQMMKEDAQEMAYLEFADEPAPDKRNYYAIEAECYLKVIEGGRQTDSIRALVRRRRIYGKKQSY